MGIAIPKAQSEQIHSYIYPSYQIIELISTCYTTVTRKIRKLFGAIGSIVNTMLVNARRPATCQGIKRQSQAGKRRHGRIDGKCLEVFQVESLRCVLPCAVRDSAALELYQ